MPEGTRFVDSIPRAGYPQPYTLAVYRRLPHVLVNRGFRYE